MVDQYEGGSYHGNPTKKAPETLDIARTLHGHIELQMPLPHLPLLSILVSVFLSILLAFWLLRVLNYLVVVK